MVSNEIKSIIGQYCPGYEAKSILSILSMGNLSESCNNCTNFIREQCIKDLLDPMKEKIERN